MANSWYLGSVQHAAVDQWAASTSYDVGDIVRQLAAPAANSERCFRCTTAGTSDSSEPSWTLTQAGTTNDNDVVWTEVTGNSAYDWDAAGARLQLFLTATTGWAAAGDTVYVADDHAATITGADLTFTSRGTEAAPVRVLCVDPAGAVPPTATTTGAKETTNRNVYIRGCAYIEGVFFDGESGYSSNIANLVNVASAIVFSRCEFNVAFPFAIGGVGYQGIRNKVRYENCIFNCDNATRKFTGGDALIEWFGGSLLGATMPTTLIGEWGEHSRGELVIRGVDLSLMGAGKALLDVGSRREVKVHISNCRIGAGTAITSGTFLGPGSPSIEVVNCDSAAKNYIYHKACYQGVITDEATNVRTGGASDGTTDIARCMVSSANTHFFSPLELDCNVQWNEDTGSSKTATVHVMTDGVTLDDDECWLEIEYLGSSSYPISSFARDRATDIMTAGANQATSTETWDETDISSAVMQKLEVEFTPNMKGPVKGKVMLAKASTTVYVCPAMVIT